MAEKKGMYSRFLKSGFLLALACLMQFALAAEPDFSTNESRLDFVEALLEKYPDIIRANLQYRRNLMQVLKQFHELSEKLGPNLTSVKDRQLSTLELSYAPGGKVAPNEEAIKKLKAGFQNDIDRLPHQNLQGLAEDLNALQELSTTNGKLDADLFKKNVARFIRQVPMLYDAKGAPINQGADWKAAARQRLVQSEISDLENLYADMFLQHQLPLLDAAVKAEKKKSGFLDQVLKTQTSNLKREVAGAARPVVQGGQEAVRHLRLEEVLSPVDIFRGCFGKDCSILSVPYFPAIKGTKTYFVHKSKTPGGQPEGYLFVAPVEVNGKMLPYVITANGNLTAEDVKKAVQAVALDWGVDEYVRVNFQHAPNVVNSEAMRIGLRSGGEKAVRVQLPPGWEEVSKFIKANGVGYQNYYAAESVQDAFVAKVQVESPDLLAPIKRTVAASKPLQPAGKIMERPAIDRALLGAGATMGTDKETRAFVLQRLNLTPEQLKAGEILQAKELALNLQQYQTLQKEFRFSFRDLETLDLAKWMHSLNKLHSESAATVATPEEWTRAYERVFADISKDWTQAQDLDRQRLFANLKGFLEGVPQSQREASRPFVQNLVDWMGSAEHLPYARFLEFLQMRYNGMKVTGNRYVSDAQFKALWPKILEAAPRMDQASLKSFTNFLIPFSASWPEAEARAAWAAWSRGIAANPSGSGSILGMVPEKFWGMEWFESAWKFYDYYNRANIFLRRFKNPSTPPPLPHEQAMVARLEKELLEQTEALLRKPAGLGGGHQAEALLELVSLPEYHARFQSRLGREGLNKQLFDLVQSDDYSSYPSPNKYRKLEKMGLLEKFLQEGEFSGGWWKGEPEFRLAKGLVEMLSDAKIPLATRKLMRQRFLEQAARRYEQFIYARPHETFPSVGSVHDLFNPYLRDLLGAQEHDRLLNLLDQDLTRHFRSLQRQDRVALYEMLRKLAVEGPPEAAGYTYGIMDRLGMWKDFHSAPAGTMAQRMKENPEIARNYRRGKGIKVSRILRKVKDSCSEFFAELGTAF